MVAAIKEEYFDSDFVDFESFDELINYNLLYLDGKIPETFHYYRSVAEETIPVLEKLKKINSYGFFTVCSQPSLYETKSIKSCEGNWNFEAMQKGYIDGYIEPNSKSDKLIQYLLNNDNFYTQIGCLENDYYTDNIIWEFKGDYKVYNITKNRTQRNGIWSEWNYPTNIHPGISACEAYQVDLLEECFNITIVSKEYNKGSVFDELLKFYEKV